MRLAVHLGSILLIQNFLQPLELLLVLMRLGWTILEPLTLPSPLNRLLMSTTHSLLLQVEPRVLQGLSLR